LIYEHGVPSALRGHLWALAGAARESPGRYAALLAACGDGGGDPAAPLEGAQRSAFAESASQIEKDLPRTCATRAGDASIDDSASARGLPALSSAERASLRRVLRAYAFHNPVSGYTQGLNFIAALLVATPPVGLSPEAAEEAAFWTLVAVVEDVLPGYFTAAMVAAQVDQAVLEALAEARLHSLTAQLARAGVPLGCVATPWLVAAFATACLPRVTLLRVWDALLLERSRAVLFQVALALLAPLEARATEAAFDADAGALVAALQSAGASEAAEPAALLAAARGRFGDVTWPALRALYRTHHKGVARALAVAGRLSASAAGGSFDASPAAQDAAAARGAGGRLLRTAAQAPLPPAFGAWAVSTEHWGSPAAAAAVPASPTAAAAAPRAADAFRSPFDSPRAAEARRARNAPAAAPATPLAAALQQQPCHQSPEDEGGGPVGGFLRGARRLLHSASKLGVLRSPESDAAREATLAAREAAVAAREAACAAREAEMPQRVMLVLVCCEAG
jgi:hypothetical protein